MFTKSVLLVLLEVQQGRSQDAKVAKRRVLFKIIQKNIIKFAVVFIKLIVKCLKCLHSNVTNISILRAQTCIAYQTIHILCNNIFSKHLLAKHQ